MSRPFRGKAFAASLLVVLAVFAGCDGAPGESLEGWNLLLITLDTTRRDFLGCYGREAARTPQLDALADEGVLFENAIAQAPITLPAHASILTGTYPPFHKVRGNAWYALPAERETLAEVLHAAGYQTAAVVGAFVLHRKFGLAQGYTVYDDDVGELPGESAPTPERRAAEVTDAALAAVSEFSQETPFFLWVHYFDPHRPFEASGKFRASFPGTEEGTYDAEIAATDDAIGTLLYGLKERGLAGRTLTIVIADHGEGVTGPHEEKSHGVLLYGDTLNIPFLVSAPGALPAGRRVSRLVEQVDVLPTALDLLGIDAPEEVQGSSLRSLLRGAPSDDEVKAYSETLLPWDAYGWSPLYQIQTDEWKYIEGPKPELYAWVEDPDESTDRITEHPEIAAELRAMLEEMRAEPGVDARVGASQLALDPADVERLRALGYVSSGPSTPPDVDPAELKNPRDWIHLSEMRENARALSFEGKIPEAIREMERILEQDPANVSVLLESARLHHRAGDLEESERKLRKIIEARPDDARAVATLGDVLLDRAQRAGQSSDAAALSREAIGLFEEALTLDPAFLMPAIRLATTYSRVGRYSQAETYARRAVLIDPTSYDANALLANALVSQDRLREAVPYIEAAESLTGEDPQRRRNLLFLRGTSHLGLGEWSEAERCFRDLVENFPGDRSRPQFEELLARARARGQ